MDMQNKGNTKAVLFQLEAVYDYMLKKPVNELTAFNETFCMVVDDLDPLAVRAAAIQWLTSSNAFMPKPGELRQIALEIQRKAAGQTALPDAAAAWIQARKYCGAWMQYRSYGGTGYHEVINGELVPLEFEQCSFYPAGIHAAVVDACKTLGITRIHYTDPMDTSAEGTLFAQFKATYGTVAERVEKQNEVMHPMIGAALSGVMGQIRERSKTMALNGANGSGNGKHD